ncbi:MAG: 2TM domain-containing protein [Stigonema ocellatum SAG 48.90 = DSM 106950]|nr:2TM domain-containing protein [Stigonema ocellatum SAG 48.90 = DSM 106950]
MTFDTKTTRFYNQEDVQQILGLAIARHALDKNKEFSYDQLLEIAAELEISPESLNLAEREWLAQQGELQQRQAFNAHRQGRFKKRLGNYVIVNAVLLLVDLLGGGGLSWSLYVLLFWGLAVGLDGWNTYQTKGEDYEVAFQKWYRKHQVKKLFSTAVSKWFKGWQI